MIDTKSSEPIEKRTERRVVTSLKATPVESISAASLKLAMNGWCLLEGISQNEVPSALSQFGKIIPQFSGELVYDVKARPEFSGYQYSKSANTIHPHTEAPVYEVPPKYLALYCVRQARCGGGHTLLADGYEFINNLPHELLYKAMTLPLAFGGFEDPSKARSLTFSHTAVLTTLPGSAPILRFSHNVFRYDNLHPKTDEPERADFNSDPFFRSMIERGLAYFYSDCLKILAPERSLLIFDNHRMLHARLRYEDTERHLQRYWLS